MDKCGYKHRWYKDRFSKSNGSNKKNILSMESYDFKLFR